ncbi:uncharacterized protein BXZ73DRAFT_103512 [Epithele typhae]|uniref:uncharacterized protein n=1 Tax=Epithele typhae TaxID=378194 RepID=UPI0020088451|nr:uncharacterized protein BXZ73DRAFT_103512 [Epithele typhae]KAH9924672.1 hypothetical protein BXZ73DRAFT_103512 [Epithele typhae]
MPSDPTSSRPTSPEDNIPTEDDYRPTKRRRYSEYEPTCRQITLEEIDLEIALRNRLAETIQLRIEWAHLLQESLRQSGNYASSDFRTVSLEALDAVEAPCNIVFRRESRLFSTVQPSAQPAPPVLPPPPSVPVESSKVSSRSTRTRGLARVPHAPPKRLIFIRDTSVNPPEVAKLACPHCARSDFSNLQGLLNHSRIRHQVEYGSHDECVQNCAVLVSEGDREWVVANGIEIGGVSLPSLKRLFEIAVGAGGQSGKPAPTTAPPPLPKLRAVSEDAPSQKEAEQASSPAEPAPTSTHVTRTLGYHADSPALAPFLGKVAKRRCINVRVDHGHDQVDIELQHPGHKTSWRKLYVHRNAARKELDEVVAPPSSEANAARYDAVKSSPADAISVLSRTRFHMVARVHVADYSRFVHPEHRVGENATHTHHWRLVIRSPSYSLPLSSVLQEVQISSVTDPPPASLTTPIIVKDPPYIVTSTTDTPFLARLVFTWAGGMNPATEIEHWVELDPMRSPTAVLGDEQVFDVELDHHTELLVAQEYTEEVPWDGILQPVVAAAKPEKKVEAVHILRLKSLLPKFPLTIGDLKGRTAPAVPYTLVDSSVHFKNLNYGRRKAIEMGRARAMRDAYAQLVTGSQAGDPNSPALSTVEVLHWLEDEGHLPRPPSSRYLSRKEATPLALVERQFCRVCGRQRAHHFSTLEEDSEHAVPGPEQIGHSLGPAPMRVCTTFREAITAQDVPLFDVSEFLDAGSQAHAHANPAIPFTAHPTPSSASNHPSSSRPPSAPVAVSHADVVAAADPRLVLAIARLTGLPFPQRISTVEPVATAVDHNGPNAPHHPSGSTLHQALPDPSVLTRAQAEERLAAAATLALAVRAFARALVARGLESARADAEGGERHRRRGGRNGTAETGAHARVLTPTHVLDGVARGAGLAAAGDGALWACVAQLGGGGRDKVVVPTDAVSE